MIWTKIFGYFLIVLAIYLLVCLFASIAPVLLNTLGIGIPNNSLLSKQHNYYFDAPMRSTMQGDAGCVEADNKLGYRPKLGDCVFKNFEFDTVLKFDENGAAMPKQNMSNTKENIIVVGDSHAMGWGVSYDKTFSYLLSEKGYQVSNFSMSSYGTEQEVLSAISSEQFNASDTIIIQYCANDIVHNRQNINQYSQGLFNDYKGRTRTEFTLYDKLHNAAKWHVEKFSMEDFFLFPLKIINSSFKKFEQPKSASSSHEHQKFVMNILNKYDALKTKNIIIFYSNGHGKIFDNWDNSKGKIKFVDLDLKRFHYNMIDDHLNDTGHEYIAIKLDVLLSEIQ